MIFKFFILSLLTFIINLTLNLTLQAQKLFPQNYFISPLDIPLYLSGTFAELRTDHFHSGIDIRTNEMEGLIVHASANGYISRIKVSAGGYGKALYITHPNGYVTVYGHLKQFSNPIADYVKKVQYERQSFEVEIFPDQVNFTVMSGDIIGFSGNTGSSGGPHLHFEIRESQSEKPMNPLLFGFKVDDKQPPVINIFKVYPIGKGSKVDGKESDAIFFVQDAGNSLTLSGNDTIIIEGNVYCGINTWDPFNSGANKNGVYSVRLFSDSTLVYEQCMVGCAFDETRYINSLIDYREFVRNKRTIQKSYIQPNNHLSIYNPWIGDGIIRLMDNEVRFMRYEVADIAGNTSELSFYLRSEGAGMKPGKNEPDSATQGTVFTYLHENVFRESNIILHIPGKALYDTLTFEYSFIPGMKGTFSGIHKLHHSDVPLHEWCDLSLSPDSIPARLQQKTAIAKAGNANNLIFAGGNWEGGYVHTRIREFGDYCITVDTIPPEIRIEKSVGSSGVAIGDTISFIVTDEFSGIGNYSGWMNGQWVLVEYDQKNDRIYYVADERLIRGINNFELTASDRRNNQTKLSTVLKY